MDYIREFDIRLDKEMFYAGEILEGHVVLDTIENFKLKSKLHDNIIFILKKSSKPRVLWIVLLFLF